MLAFLAAFCGESWQHCQYTWRTQRSRDDCPTFCLMVHESLAGGDWGFLRPQTSYLRERVKSLGYLAERAPGTSHKPNRRFSRFSRWGGSGQVTSQAENGISSISHYILPITGRWGYYSIEAIYKVVESPQRAYCCRPRELLPSGFLLGLIIICLFFDIDHYLALL